jgi:glyoxylase-like metal-dependent hydrolase (beta-lactamase superfamily II)
MSTTSESTNPALPDISASTPPIVQGEPVELIGGVFVIPDRRVQVVPNVGIVVGRDAALVIDSGLGPRNGDYVLEHAKQLAGKRPLYLTVTHFHPEHGFGAQAFKGVATIVYNRAQRDELRRKGGGYVEMFKGMSAAVATELADVQFVDPDLVYDGQVEIDLGGHTVVLRHVGPAHTVGDQTVIVDNRIIFGGDLVETRRFPILPYFPPFDVDVDGKRWIEVLDSLLAWQPEIVVPGHGEVTDASLIRDVREYLVFVRDEAARLRADGGSAGSAVATIGDAARARWSTWDDPEWIDFAARWFYEAAA